MHSTLLSVALLGCLCNLAVAAKNAYVSFADDDILLKLDYGTYRGYYNSTKEVILSIPIYGVLYSSKNRSTRLEISGSQQNRSVTCAGKNPFYRQKWTAFKIAPKQ
jgi:hypothetical protein